MKNAPSQAAGWVVFPATGAALQVTTAADPLVVLPKWGGKVYAYDRLHLVRGVQAKVDATNGSSMDGLWRDLERVVEALRFPVVSPRT